MSAGLLAHTRLTLARCWKPTRTHSRFLAAQASLSVPSHDPHLASTLSQLPSDEDGGVASEESTPKQGRSSGKTRKLQPVPESPRRSSLRPSGVEVYLSKLHAAGMDPTLDDLDRCRPRRTPSGKLSNYPEEHRRLVDTLCRSFSKDQLRTFLAMAGTPGVRSKRKKIEYAEIIIEQYWGWPSLKEIEKAKRDRTEVVSRSFPVNAHQLFLILGRDGSDLLQMSLDFNVHISLSPQPLALNIEGVRGSMKQVEEHLSTLEKGIVDDVFQLPTGVPLPSHLVQRISRLAGAYIENIGQEGKVKIYAKDARNLANAHRLVVRASQKVHLSSQPQLLSYTPHDSVVPVTIFPHSYALYPFLSPRALPWTMNNSGAFRIRKVGEWLGDSRGEDITTTGGLTGGRNNICSIDSNHVDLANTLLGDSADADNGSSVRSRIVKASLGHLLFISGGQRASLSPPFKGYHQFSRMMKWVQGTSSRPTFVTSLPPSLVDSSPHHQKILHRLQYRALSGPQPVASSPKATPPMKLFSFEVELPHPSFDETSSEPATSENESQLTFIPIMHESQQQLVDLMMPDRNMDMQLSVIDLTVVQEGEGPPELLEYSNNMRDYLSGSEVTITQPDPPIAFTYKGDSYILDASDSIRRSSEDVHGAESSTGVHMITESVLDLETNQKATQCEIICPDPSSQQNWLEFLTLCDKVTTLPWKPVKNIVVADGVEDLS